EEQGVHALGSLEHGVTGLLIHQRRLPPAVGESAVAILVAPAGRLCHPIQRDELGDYELAHGLLLRTAMRHSVDDIAGPKSSPTPHRGPVDHDTGSAGRQS